MAKKKEIFDYKKITLEQMVYYILDNNKKDAIDLNSFMTETEKYRLENVIDKDGKPETYINKDGKVKIKKKQVKTGEKTQRYNFLKAKKEFYNTFKDDIEWTNPPTGKTEKRATDILALLK